MSLFLFKLILIYKILGGKVLMYFIIFLFVMFLYVGCVFVCLIWSENFVEELLEELIFIYFSLNYIKFSLFKFNL